MEASGMPVWQAGRLGGLAAVAHGAMRATFDIDIVPRWKPDNLDALAGALRAADARLRVPEVAVPVKARDTVPA